MAQRALRLVFHLHRVSCPNCSAIIEYNTLTEILPDAEKTCPKCSKGFMIYNNLAKRFPAKRPEKCPATQSSNELAKPLVNKTHN